MQLLRARLDARGGRIVAAFSEEGQVLLTLDRAYPFRVNGARGLAARILFNVDRRDALLAALGVPAAAGTPAAPPPAADRPAGAVGMAAAASPSSPPAPSRTAGGGSAAAEAAGPPAATPAGPPALGATVAPPTRPGDDAEARSARPGAGIRTERLTRRFGGVAVIDALDLAIAPGEIYGFLGPNGAGKTTTIKLLVGLLEPDAGSALVAGHDVWAEPVAAKAALGYVADRAILYDRLTGREFLDFLAQLRGTPRREADARARELLALLDLAEYADLPCGTYSFGMKRKLALAGALLHRPAALILDEPLNGLDPRAARRVKRLLAGLAGDGTAILLSTHDLATAESICHRVGILHRGRLIAEGATPELRRLAAAPDLEAVFLELTADEPEEHEEAAV
jgi:ABC-2 type transport system ATP-binding protein